MKSEKLKGIPLLLIGICLLGAGVYFLRAQLEFISNSVETPGVVEELSTHLTKGTTYYTPVVVYTVDEQQYRVTGKVSSSSFSTYEVGEAMNVRYLKDNPASAEVVSFWNMWGITAVLLGLGGVFFAIGVYELRTSLHKRKMRMQLPLSGKQIQLAGRVEEKKTKNGTSFFVLADWQNPTDGSMITFSSEKINYDPTQFVKDKELKVWIDPLNPKKNHYMDLSFLPSTS